MRVVLEASVDVVPRAYSYYTTLQMTSIEHDCSSALLQLCECTCLKLLLLLLLRVVIGIEYAHRLSHHSRDCISNVCAHGRWGSGCDKRRGSGHRAQAVDRTSEYRASEASEVLPGHSLLGQTAMCFLESSKVSSVETGAPLHTLFTGVDTFSLACGHKTM